MSNPINGLPNAQPPLLPPLPTAGVAAGAPEARVPLFQNLLVDSMNQVESLQQTAQQAVEKGLAGGDITQVEVLTSMKKADLALRMMVQIRNKMLEAYDEIKQLRM